MSQPSASTRPSAAAASTPRAADHAEDLKALLARLEASSAKGLTEDEAAARLERHGRNALPAAPREPSWLRLLKQFQNPLVLTLLAAAIIATVVGITESEGRSTLERFGDAIAILLIVVMNAFIGFFQERRAEAALEALQRLAAPNARVRREGRIRMVPAAELVPGDLIELEAGDSVPADARLLQTIDLGSEESSLTGESSPVGKDAVADVPADAPLADRVNMVFTGTTVVRGKGRAVVTTTGPHTELGRIGEMIRSIGAQKTPLEERLEHFGSIILKVCLGAALALMLWGFARGGRSWHVLLLEAVSLAVAAIPEGLPAITTITLALGMQRMAKRGAIVRKLPAVETLGAASVICSDKTGTLTQNEMMVREIYTYGQAYTVSGEGYDPQGEIRDSDNRLVDVHKLPGPLDQTLATAALCNNASLAKDAETGRWKVTGDPTEGALLTVAAKVGHEQQALSTSHQILAELPFDSDRKRMTIVARDAQGRDIAHVKGSVDVLLPRSVAYEHDGGTAPLDEEARARILAVAEAMSKKALRVLALCRRETSAAPSSDLDSDAPPPSRDAENLERELTFLGLCGMMDPPRAGVAEAVATCATAGIRAVMITGDHKLTAQAVAEEIGLWVDGDVAITGSELAQLSDDELAARIMHIRVFARTTAEQKLQIVRAFKKAGHIVAMTGDGVNDAPALREAHIGVAMGLQGTDVARQAADLVLQDDNFATIVEAVREGRAIYRNIQKFIFFLLSSNMGLVVAVFVVSLFKSWPPLTPLMILWINLVTNGLPALALGMDPPDKMLMQEPPRRPDEGLIGMREYLGILYVGLVMGGAAVLLYALSPRDEASLEHTRALAFTLLALSPLVHAFSCRSQTRSIVSSRPLVSLPLLGAVVASAALHLIAILVPALRPVFKTFAVTGEEWSIVLGLSLLVVPTVEIAKFFQRRKLFRLGLGGSPSSRVFRR
ncbi:MAG: cation-translocating P-type ATPase [Myxococcales bacterium]|nr:cation-translocating P-type ATPase [Myxococcales bacterium]